MQNYILITPVKNEGDSLPNLILSITSQSIKPIVWFIVNDGSTDDTEIIIAQATKQYDWIHIVKLPESQRDIGFHYTHVCQQGFEAAINYANKHNIFFSFIGLLDADVYVDNNYFEYLLIQMGMDPKLGVVSGWTLSKKGSKYIQEIQYTNLPSGAARLWRYQCFIETKGYEIVMSPDSVSNARALIGGWSIRRFEEVRAFQSRETSSAEGLWKGYKTNGEHAYYLHFHIISIIGKLFHFIIRGEMARGIAYFYGYSIAHLKRVPRLSDNDLVDFFNKKSLKALLGEQP
jgi:glycosyltransferase involved in cell wall biosynthesis